MLPQAAADTSNLKALEEARSILTVGVPQAGSGRSGLRSGWEGLRYMLF